MIKFDDEYKRHSEVYTELLYNLPSIKIGSEFYYFGAATIITSLLNWLDQVEKDGIENINVDEFRREFKAFYEHNPDIKKYMERLEEDYK